MSFKKLDRQPTQQQRLDKRNQKFIEKYGISYSEIQDKVNKNKKKQKGFVHIKKISCYAREYKKSFILTLILVLIGGFISIVSPIALQNTIDNLTAMQWNQVYIWGTIYAVSTALMFGCYWAYNICATRSLQGLSHNMRVALAKAVLNVKSSKYDTVSSGEILNRINNDTEKLSNNFGAIIDWTTYLLEDFIFIIYAFVVNIWLGLVMVACGFIQFITYFIYNKKYQKINQRRNSAIGDKSTSAFNEMVRGSADVKNLNIKVNMLRKLTGISKNKFNSIYDTTKQQQGFRKVGQIVSNLSLIIFFVIAIFMIQNAMITVGGVLILLVYRWSMVEAFDSTNQIYELMQDSEVRAERICEILDEETYPKEHFGTLELEQPRGDIEFKNVTFTYRDDVELFKNMSFKIKAGETIGIVGKSGQGKSTILNLIPRLYDIDSGEILLDDTNIVDLTEKSLRNVVSVVPQSPYIFNMSIKENLRFAKPTATDDEIIEACKKAQIHDFILSKPEGYDSVIGEGGLMLSGGQRQRLAIARALLKDSKVLLLDEATSALDNESQQKIKDVIQNLEGRTVIIVAHRLTTVIDCDRIFVVDDHKIVADGTHQKLKENCEIYRNLYQSEEQM